MSHQYNGAAPAWVSALVTVCFVVCATLFFYSWNQHSKAIDAGQQYAKDVTLAKIDDPQLEKVAAQILASIDLTYCWERRRDEVFRSGTSNAHLWATEKSKRAIKKSAELAFNQCYATRLLDMRTLNGDGVGDKLLAAMLPRPEKQSAMSGRSDGEHE